MLVILAPFLIIAFYTYPVADDYNYGQEAYRVWVREQNHSLGSIFYLIKYAFSVAYSNWRYDRGEYSSFIFSCLMPSAFGDHTTWLNAWLMIGISALAVWKFVKVVFGKWLGLHDKDIYICLPVILFYMVSYLPSISQGFYWFNGAFYNLFITSVGIIYIVDCIYNVLSGAQVSVKRQLGIIFLAWLVGGGNYASILVWGILLILLLLYVLYDTRKISICWLKYFIPFCVFAGLNLLAPCNLNRTWETEKSYIETIIDSLIAVPNVYGSCLIKTPLVFVLFIMGIIVWNNMDVQMSNRKKIHPVFLIILTYLLGAAMICPVLYAQGFLGQGRVYNVYYMVFIFLAVFDWVYTVRYIKLYFANGKYNYSRIKWGKQINTLLVIILIGNMFLGDYTDDVQYSNIKFAYGNLLDGRVFRYSGIMEERIRIYSEHQGEEVVVPGTKENYNLYMYYDLRESKDEWVNGVVAEYYGVASVTPVVKEKALE